MPGSISPATGLVQNANSTWLNGRAVQPPTSNAAIGRQVRLANDANCFALSEATDGAGCRSGQCVWRDPRHRCAAAASWLTRRTDRWAAGHRRRVGTQPSAVARRQRVSRTNLLVRKCKIAWKPGFQGPGLAADHARVTGELRGSPPRRSPNEPKPGLIPQQRRDDADGTHGRLGAWTCARGQHP